MSFDHSPPSFNYLITLLTKLFVKNYEDNVGTPVLCEQQGKKQLIFSIPDPIHQIFQLRALQLGNIIRLIKFYY